MGGWEPVYLQVLYLHYNYVPNLSFLFNLNIKNLKIILKIIFKETIV